MARGVSPSSCSALSVLTFFRRAGLRAAIFCSNVLAIALSPILFDPRYMLIKARVRFFDELAIKPLFAAARFIPAHQQNGLPLGVEGEGDAPHAVRSVEPKFLHVCVTRSFQRIHARPAQCRAELL